MKKNLHRVFYITCLQLVSFLLVSPLFASEESAETANIIKAFKIYNPGYEPPHWVIGFSKDEIYKAYCKEAIIYTTSEDKKLAFKMANEREPVNIGMGRGYDEDQLKEDFGWKYSAYQRYYDTDKKLPPQIAILCKTPVIVEPEKGYESEEFDKDKSYGIYILNMIGTGLDSPKQPDYQYFIEEKSGEITSEKKQEMKDWYFKAFSMSFQCALDKGIFKRVVISQFGANNFARLYPGGKEAFVKEIWIPAFKESLQAYKDRLKAGDINEISFMGEHLPKEVPEFIKNLKFKTTNYGLIPDIFKEGGKLADERNTTLFYNCWDPHTLPGNGNRNDPSLDGRFGKITAIMALCWPLSNPYLTEKAIQTVMNTTEMPLITDTDTDSDNKNSDNNSNNQEEQKNYAWLLLPLGGIVAIVVMVKIGLLEGIMSHHRDNAQKQKKKKNKKKRKQKKVL